MRIISDYHDYYDSIQRIDEERDVIWLRKEEKIILWDNYQIDENIFPRIAPFYYSLVKPFEMSRMYLGFCGKIIPIIKFTYEWINKYKELAGEKVYYYSTAEIDELINRLPEADKKRMNKYRGLRSWKEYADEVFNTIPKVDDYFIKYSVPSFLLVSSRKKGKLIKNPCLKDLTFYTQYDTMQAYQELSMFFSGVLGNVNEKIPPISNNDMIQSKGFDLKTSFRKPKGK